jgi:hypothetical protein
MIYVTVIICQLTTSSPDCLLLSDSRGPYKAIDHCISRIYEIRRDALRVLPKYKLVESKCRPEKGEQYGTKRFPNSTSSV